MKIQISKIKFKDEGPHRRKRSSLGFTVLESLVAIFVLSLSISGAFSAVVQGLYQSGISKDEIKAFYLAQEAVEIIRNKRDANQLNIIKTGTGHWLNGIAQGATYCPFSTAGTKNTCRIDAYSTNLSHCGAGDWGACSGNLKQRSDNFLYNYSSGAETNFGREVQIEQVNTNEIAVTVRVYWTRGVLTRDFKVRTLMLNSISI